MQHILKTAGMLLLAGSTLSACAMIEKSNATSDEQKLAAAGFKVKFADSPGKLAHVQSMKQREVISHIQNGAVYYAYADAEFCKCLYMGTQENYQEYAKLNVEQRTAEMNRDAAMDWNAWGGWGAWYY